MSLLVDTDMGINKAAYPCKSFSLSHMMSTNAMIQLRFLDSLINFLIKFLRLCSLEAQKGTIARGILQHNIARFWCQYVSRIIVQGWSIRSLIIGDLLILRRYTPASLDVHTRPSKKQLNLYFVNDKWGSDKLFAIKGHISSYSYISAT